MKLRLFILSIFLMIIVVGCALSNPPGNEPQTTSTQSPATISVPTVNNTLVMTPVTTSVTAVNSLSNWEESKKCVTHYPARPKDYQLSGVAAIRSLSSSVIGLSLSLLDLENGITRDVQTSGQSVEDADVSPDRQLLAYTWFNSNTSNWELVLIDSTGDSHRVVWSSNDGFVVMGWLNDHQVVILQDSTYIILDVEQDSREDLFPLDFPDFDIYNPKRFFAAFDSLLTRAIYKKSTEIIFLDLSTKTILARIQDNYDRLPIVAWQSSGERVAVVATVSSGERTPGSSLSDEIFVIEHNGHVSQLTHLYESFGRNFTIDSLSWSPDGEKIAFWLYDGQENHTTLMVADASTGQVTNYCVLNVTIDSFPVNVPTPIWSPDGKYLLVENRYAVDKSKLLVVDLLKNIAFPIAENANPLGWMVENN